MRQPSLSRYFKSAPPCLPVAPLTNMVLSAWLIIYFTERLPISLRKTGKRLHAICKPGLWPREVQTLPALSCIIRSEEPAVVRAIDDAWFANMSGELAHRCAVRIRQAAHCLLPSLKPSLPIDVRLGRPRPIGGPGAVCCGDNHGIRNRRTHRNSHEVEVLQSILRRSPRIPGIGAFEVPVAGGRVDPARCKRVRHRCVRVVRTAANVITPGPPAVERAHQRASLDCNEQAIRDAHIGFDPPNMMRVGPWGKTPGVSGRERAQAAKLHPVVAATVGAKHRTWFGAGI